MAYEINEKGTRTCHAKQWPSPPSFHFTSRIIGNDNNVWHHDGMTTRSTCENEGDFDSFSTKKMLKSKGKRLLLVIYARA